MTDGGEPRLPSAPPALEQDASEVITIPVLAERLLVSKRVVEKTLVRVATSTREREHLVDEELAQERVEVEHVPINRMVDAVPPVREEGDTTILPVVEEVVVVERRLVLKEEIHIRRLRTTERYQETVVLREQDAVVTRTEVGPTVEDIRIPEPPKRTG